MNIGLYSLVHSSTVVVRLAHVRVLVVVAIVALRPVVAPARAWASLLAPRRRGAAARGYPWAHFFPRGHFRASFQGW